MKGYTFTTSDDGDPRITIADPEDYDNRTYLFENIGGTWYSLQNGKAHIAGVRERKANGDKAVVEEFEYNAVSSETHAKLQRAWDSRNDAPRPAPTPKVTVLPDATTPEKQESRLQAGMPKIEYRGAPIKELQEREPIVHRTNIASHIGLETVTKLAALKESLESK